MLNRMVNRLPQDNLLRLEDNLMAGLDNRLAVKGNLQVVVNNQSSVQDKLVVVNSAQVAEAEFQIEEDKQSHLVDDMYFLLVKDIPTQVVAMGSNLAEGILPCFETCLTIIKNSQ